MLKMRSLLALGLAAGLLVAAAPSPALADKTGPGYSLRTATSPVTGTMVARWNPCQEDRVITYRVNARFAADPAAALADAQEAFSQLGRATGFTFRYLGPTKFMPQSGTYPKKMPKDTEIIVAWVLPGEKGKDSSLLGRDTTGKPVAGTGGQQFMSWTYGPEVHGAVSRGFVVVNAAEQVPAGFSNGLSRGALLLHELGHVMGLGHVEDSQQLMYLMLLPSLPAAYQAGDLRGLSKVGARNVKCSKPAVAKKWSDPTDVVRDVS